MSPSHRLINAEAKDASGSNSDPRQDQAQWWPFAAGVVPRLTDAVAGFRRLRCHGSNRGKTFEEFCLPRPYFHAGGSSQPSSSPPRVKTAVPSAVSLIFTTSHAKQWEPLGSHAATQTDNNGRAVMSQRLSWLELQRRLSRWGNSSHTRRRLDHLGAIAKAD